MTNENNLSNSNECFKILSLDGGGIKGLFSAAILAAIEEDNKLNIIDYFDLITGTSTGGIVSIALGLGISPKEIVNFYLIEGKNIFHNKLGLANIYKWIFSKYSSKHISNALKNCFGNKLLGDSSKRLVIPSYNLGEDDVYIFRTAHHERLKRDYKVQAWKIALATSSAPTFFPSCRLIDSIRLIDGGVWANNPTLVGIVEAIGTLKIPLNKIKVLSIGTTNSVAHRKKFLNYGGIIPWVMENSAIDIIMRGQSIGVNNQATFLLGSQNILRLNPNVASGEFSLDNFFKSDDLIGKAAHFSRSYMPEIKNKFLINKVLPFTPIYIN